MSLCLILATLLGAQERIAVLPVVVSGDSTAEVADSLRRSAAGGLEAGGGRTLELSSVDKALSDHPGLRGCATSVCLQRIGQLAQARRVLLIDAEVAGSAYSFRLKLFDAVEDAEPKTAQAECAVCTLAEANEALSRATAEMTAELPTAQTEPPPPLRIRARATSRWRRAAPWILLGAGIAAATAGGLLVGLDEEGGRETTTPGWIVLGTGGATALAAGLWLVW